MISAHTDQDEVPFSYKVKVGHVSSNPVTVKLQANENELRAIAASWDILSVESFEAVLKINRWKKDGIKVQGTVKVSLTQACVVSLEPVPSVIDEEFEQIFVPEGSKLARLITNEEGEIIISADSPDIPDQFTGDTLDVGSVVTEVAALAIEPYPRKSGVEFTGYGEEEIVLDKKPSPFAALKDWKKD